jgi:uncharacterized protein YjbJ (UPF0337 family)
LPRSLNWIGSVDRGYLAASRPHLSGKLQWLRTFKRNVKEGIMNWDQIKGSWKQLKGKAKEKWGKLTDDDLDVIAGMKDQLAGKLQERYGYHKERAEKELKEFSDSLLEKS